ncbi:TPA: helix-turn-helix domain-containing protein [Enterococcus faecalis]|nr:helix-turn-helix domain-containing protein [Enterococcus faecalis]HBI1786111.1 helix-turn-helix domain-containing protein [Enterococcus faecalis]HBI1791386.1 helix-turn-helix domain-containing protein [Enterococcus faecalis]HBI1887153.1 helix-turn-helix domain-containing protein [Enterococcus faecalis]HBI1897191.1 helix-turn-helix domain-containing protein [Enterococcus faecalis]
MINNFYMKPIDKQKYDLFVFIYFNEKNITINDISDFFLISTTSANRYIRQLNEDFQEIFNNDSVKIVSINNHYHLQNDSGKPIPYVNDILRLNYFKDTTKFKIIEAFLNKHFQSINELSEYLHISSPHLYKAIKDLNSLLETFKIEITFKTDDTSSNIVSQKERNIRIFFSFYYWSIFKGLEWPFKKVLPSQIPMIEETKLFKRSQLQRFNYLVVITKYRMYSRKKYIVLDDECLKDLSPYEKNKNFNQALHSDNYKISEEVFHQEKLFFNFLVRFYISGCDTQEQQIDIAREFLRISTPLSKYCEKLLNHLFKTFKANVSLDSWLICYYNLNTICLYFKYVGLDYSDWHKQKDSFLNPNSVNPVVESFEEEFISYYKNTLSQLPPPFELTDEVIKYISHYLFFIIDSNTPVESLKICIQYGRLFYLNDQIKYNINLIFKNIEYVDSPKDADLIISDSYQGESKTAEYFYLYDIFDEHNWKAMIAAIKELLYKKNFTLPE